MSIAVSTCQHGARVGPRLLTALVAAVAISLTLVELARGQSGGSQEQAEDVEHSESSNSRAERQQAVILVVGAAGQDEYGEMFSEWAADWRQAAKAAAADVVSIGTGNREASDRETLRNALAKLMEQDLDRVWLILLGHGTYDGESAKFNLRGPDVAASELNTWLAPLKAPTVVINCASSSGPYIKRLAAENRIVVTATRSGYELNFARLGKFLAEAIVDSKADLDKDDQVSLLEAYLTACRRLQEFYEQDARLMSEHALLDDNGDGLGTPADWFHGLRATKRAEGGRQRDGLRAHQTHLVLSVREARMSPDLRGRRDELERQVESLRDKKADLPSAEYYQRLLKIMVQLARIYEESAAEPASRS